MHHNFKRLGLICAASVFGAGVVACSQANGNESGVLDNGIMRLADAPIAQVDGSYIYDTDINRTAAEQGIILPGEVLSTDDAAYTSLLDELIDQRLLALKAKGEGLDKLPEAKRRLATSEERILGNIIVEDHLAQTVTEVEARKLYDAQMKLRQSGDEVRASHILVQTEDEAKAISEALEDGESFSKLAYDRSIDEASRSDGGDLGYFQADAMVPEFWTVVFAMSTGETSLPFESPFGWHIVTLIDRRAAPQLSFEDMRGEILNYMTYDQIKALLEELRAQADVDILVTSSDDKNAEGDVESLE